MKRKYFGYVILVLAMVGIFSISGCTQQNSKVTEEKKEKGPEKFLKKFNEEMDKGNYEFMVSNTVNKYGKKMKLFEGVSAKQQISRLKNFLGPNGKKVNISSIRFLSKSKAEPEDLKKALPDNTSIEEFYNIDFLLQGKTSLNNPEEMFGEKSSQIVKINGKWYNYGGNMLSMTFNIIYDKPIAVSIEGCNKIKYIDKDSCYMDVAEENKDPSVCPEISNRFRDSCYYMLAERTLNNTLCKKIEKKEKKSKCLDFVKTRISEGHTKK